MRAMACRADMSKRLSVTRPPLKRCDSTCARRAQVPQRRGDLLHKQNRLRHSPSGEFFRDRRLMSAPPSKSLTVECQERESFDKVPRPSTWRGMSSFSNLKRNDLATIISRAIQTDGMQNETLDVFPKKTGKLDFRVKLPSPPKKGPHEP
jgi:hypothetical protein